VAEKRIFVGREDELEEFAKVLERPQGEAILVVGQVGMGKTWLVNRMAEVAENDPQLKCGWVRYEVTRTDSVDLTMALMMDNAFEVAQVKEGSFDGTPLRLQQWKALLNIINIGDLVFSLKRDPGKNTREQFLQRMELISKRMPENGRAVFIIDPEKYMQEKSDQSWAIVVKNLPEKIKFVFAQRPEDALVESETIDELDNVVRIPEKRLGVLEKKAIDKLLKLRAKQVGYAAKQLDKALGQYKGHPYALGAALDLLEAGIGLEELPKKGKPIKFAEVQWKKVCSSGDGAIELFEAYAVLEVGVPDDVVEVVSGLKSSRRRKLLADKYLGGLLREEGQGKRIYHAILADHILEEIGQAEKNKYHKRATEVYRKHLAGGIKKETLAKVRIAAIRLPEHALESEGQEAFVDTIVNECVNPLSDLGELEAAKWLGRRALETCSDDGAKVSAIVRQLARICWKQGQLNKAELLIKTDLETVQKEERADDIPGHKFMIAGILLQRGELDEAEAIYSELLELTKDEDPAIYANLGVICWRRGFFPEAMRMQRKALRGYARLRNKEGMVEAYGNFGAIYLSQGNLQKAYYAISKALKLTSRVDVIASMCSNLAMIHMTYGRFDEAKGTLGKTITINMGMGNIEGAARDLANLGGIHRAKGEIDKAREVWIKARDGYDIVGMKDMAKKVQGWIDGLSKK